MSAQEYAIRKSLEHEREEIVQLMLEHYVTCEPTLAVFLKRNERRLSEAEAALMRSDLRRRYEVMLCNFICLVAVCRESHRIVGVNMMNVEENPSLPTRATAHRLYEDVMDPVPIESSLLSEYYRHVIAAAEADIDFFKKFPQIKNTLETIIICVDRGHRNRGLATALLGEAVSWARQHRIELVFGQFTSPYSKRAAEKLGFHSYQYVDSLSFKDSEGNPVYGDIDPLPINEMAIFVCADETSSSVR